uniref:hypothetical protein n=1 Tax=Blastococcus atacamensis TaxID=2070508 RepID=UPI0018E403E4
MNKRNLAALAALTLVGATGLAGAALARTEPATGVPVDSNGNTVQVVTVEEFDAAIADLQAQLDAATSETPTEPEPAAPEP